YGRSAVIRGTPYSRSSSMRLICLLLAMAATTSYAEPVTVSWTNAIENTDGSPYTNPASTRIKYYRGNDPSVLTSNPCTSSQLQCATVNHPGSELELDLPAGTWTFVGYHITQSGEFSEASAP